jgi:hypothetical protein
MLRGSGRPAHAAYHFDFQWVFNPAFDYPWSSAVIFDGELVRSLSMAGTFPGPVM